MATATIDAAGESVGPVQGVAGILALTGTMTAGGIIVMVRPQGGDTYYPSDYVSASAFQQVPNEAGDGYGFVHGFTIPGGGHAKAVASASFEGNLEAEIRPAELSAVPGGSGGGGLGAFGAAAKPPLAQAADADLTVIAGRATTFAIALAAGATNVMQITITAKDAGGTTVTGVHAVHFWISEDAQGEGLTADSASGDLAVTTGTELQEIVSKKHYVGLTDVNGVLVATLEDSGTPADQYVVARQPQGGALVVSAASGTNWGA